MIPQQQTNNKELIEKFRSFMQEINFKLTAFDEVDQNFSDEKTIAFLQELIVNDLQINVDDLKVLFPYR